MEEKKLILTEEELLSSAGGLSAEDLANIRQEATANGLLADANAKLAGMAILGTETVGEAQYYRLADGRLYPVSAFRTFRLGNGAVVLLAAGGLLAGGVLGKEAQKEQGFVF